MSIDTLLNLTGGTTWAMPQKFLDDTDDYLVKALEELPSELPSLKISEHAEKYRVLPSGTPRAGILDLSYTPYLIEPMNCLGPDSSIQQMVVLKGAQGGWTMLAECILCYYIGYAPADILFMSSTYDSLERWGSRRLEPAINSYGYRKFIYAEETNTKSKKTGDKTYSKEYFGCRLDMASYDSPGAMASTDKRILLRDEVDRAKEELATGEGSPMEVSAVRVNAWGDRSKIFDFSTPRRSREFSYIWKRYVKGDQRKYFMPCPSCKKKIQYEFLFDVEKHGRGFKPIFDGEEVIDCVYVCECGYEIKEYEKASMMALENGAEWRATTKSSDRFLRSYYWPSMLAPASMLSWTKIYKKYLEALDDPNLLMKTFVNLYGGLPFEEPGGRPKIENVHHLRGLYKSWSIPKGVLFLTAAIDVQRGAEKYQTMNSADLKMEMDIAKKKGKIENFPRLEMEILGHGAGYRTWSIGYKRFEGHILDIEAGAWEGVTDFFNDLKEKSELVQGGKKIAAIKRHDGYYFGIPVVFVDARDGSMTEIVYSYTQSNDGFYPSMGSKPLSEIKKKGDIESVHDKGRYRLSKSAGKDIYFYAISGNYYKKIIYNRANFGRVAMGEQRPGFMDHPMDYNDLYFKMLFAEDLRKDGSFHDGGRRNEALDIKVYNLCAGDVYLEMQVEYWRQVKHVQGYSTEKCRKEITTPWVLKWLENVSKVKESN